MSELISRQDAIEAVATVTMSIHLSNVLCDKLLALPSADRPTGEWVDADGNKVRLDADGNPLDSCWCSNCGEWLVASDEYKVLGKFCPNCGAKMRGETE